MVNPKYEFMFVWRVIEGSIKTKYHIKVTYFCI